MYRWKSDFEKLKNLSSKQQARYDRVVRDSKFKLQWKAVVTNHFRELDKMVNQMVNFKYNYWGGEFRPYNVNIRQVCPILEANYPHLSVSYKGGILSLLILTLEMF